MDLVNLKPFIWRKKYEQLGIDIDDKAIEAEARQQIEENKIELEKLKERQRKRELEYQQKLSDNEFLQRQKETQEHEHWEQQEDDFILRQHRLRSKIRIRDGRAKTIDLLAHYIDVFGAKPDPYKNQKSTAFLMEDNIDLTDSHVELLNPCDWFNGLSQSELDALEPDISIYMSADCEMNRQYWQDILHITKNEQAQIKRADRLDSAISMDIASLFKDKDIHELDEMEDEMSRTLKSDDPSIDTLFYENALLKLRAHRAQLRLTKNHKKNLKEQKARILKNPTGSSTTTGQRKSTVVQQDERMVVEETGQSKSKEETRDKVDSDTTGAEIKEETIDDDLDDEEEDYEEAGKTRPAKFDAARAVCIEEYESGGYSPKKLSESDLDPGIICVDYEKEHERLAQYRNQICNVSSLDELRMATMSKDEKAFMEAAQKGMSSHEESEFKGETDVRGPHNRAVSYAWSDRFVPRKPRYFNRIHTGFEWNKYNQTHYDIDNPPPKVVQGYKFNIFYPDLIEKSKAPTFTLTPCKEDRDFSIIRFSAGPPYEDIAFRIVNREWNNSHKAGYRCQFINNMLQLWFQFKRYRYRR